MSANAEQLVSLEELGSVLVSYAGPGTPRERSLPGVTREWSLERRRRQLRPLVIAAVVAIAAVGTGLAIADGFGAFNGISAAQHPQTGADMLDAKTLAGLQNACQGDGSQRFYMPFCHLELDSARLVGNIPSFGNVYAISDTRGDLCTISEGGDGSCGAPLSNTQPISFGTFNPSPTTGGIFVASGLAIDGVAAVSFTVGGKAIEVPVKNNGWVYSEPDSHATMAQCIVAHLADGSTVNPFPEVPCP